MTIRFVDGTEETCSADWIAFQHRRNVAWVSGHRIAGVQVTQEEATWLRSFTTHDLLVPHGILGVPYWHIEEDTV